MFFSSNKDEKIVLLRVCYRVALMISVSSSFATPIGSPTHLLVYGPGGYRFSDFLRIGLLMNIIILTANIFIVSIVYPLTPLH